MNSFPSASLLSSEALSLVQALQQRFVEGLEDFGGQKLHPAQWRYDGGRHGGGIRYGLTDGIQLGCASVNVSHVHYGADSVRKISSVAALSAIVHPVNPHAPSVHIHISWTESGQGAGYWRIMADLNPALPCSEQTQSFAERLREAAPGEFDEAARQGDCYFFIPALNRHRGTVHFYLENYNTGDFCADRALAQRVGEAAVDEYIRVVSESVVGVKVTDADRAAQLAYHTLYFFQVLTLDRGTTSGLLVHNQNDLGILGSLPPRIDKNLLASWRSRLEPPQHLLLDHLLAQLPNCGVCTLDDATKGRLADAVRVFYQACPEARDLQASGGCG